ncbi:MAG: LacI family DNA-binding transcriptional regulator [Candidatus Caldatribacterium sp.]|nr:LacI family DNA-binding transcriptional regulator [Candidatus Caldatribacterium sp.]
MAQKKVTTRLIAELCGVSRGTVDRALHDRRGISPETKARILEVAKELGYKSNFVARSLVKGRTRIIGMVVFNLYNRFFAQVVNAAEEEARRRGYSLLLALTNKDCAEEKRQLERLAGWRVDGIILAPVCRRKEVEEYLCHLSGKLGIPVVTICNRVSDAVPFVGIRDREVTKEAVRTIASKGYQRVVFLCPPLRNRDVMNVYAPEERLQGYLEAIRELDLGEPIVVDKKDFGDLIRGLILNTPKRVAIFCSSDIYALEVLSLIKGLGLKIPEDVGIMGFDDIDVLRHVNPPLSTIPYPVVEVGKVAVTNLVESVEVGKRITDVYLETKPLLRESL